MSNPSTPQASETYCTYGDHEAASEHYAPNKSICADCERGDFG